MRNQRTGSTARADGKPRLRALLIGASALLPACGQDARVGLSDDKEHVGTVRQAVVDLSMLCGPSDLASNTAGIGFPSPLESDPALTDPWALVDTLTEYPAARPDLQLPPGGTHQLTVDFGRPVTFDELTVWHHAGGGVPGNNTPSDVTLEYFDGDLWQPLTGYSRSFDFGYSQPASGAGSYPDVYGFSPTVGTKVRWFYDGTGLNLLEETEAATAVAAGEEHTCALEGTGQVLCWGAGQAGQLGNGSLDDSLAPVAVVGLSDVIAIAAGAYHTCAVRQSGEVLCWGIGSTGELGDGVFHAAPTGVAIPVAVVGLNDAVDITAGSAHTCALRQSGGVACWGRGDSGALGDGVFYTEPEGVAEPVAVVGLNDAMTVDAGSAHTCAVRQSGEAVCWGADGEGQLGDGANFPVSARSATPVGVLDLVDAVGIAAGGGHTCALRATGQVVCWGRGREGQLGDGTFYTELIFPIVGLPIYGSYVPVEVVGLNDATQLASGFLHTCALRASGDVACWGSGQNGELGSDSFEDSSTPVPASVLDDAVALGASNAGGISWLILPPLERPDIPLFDFPLGIVASPPYRGSHTCAVRGSGEVSCWGFGEHGELGNGNGGSSAVPLSVPGFGAWQGWIHEVTVDGCPGESAYDTVLAGESVGTDTEGDGATPADPVETTVTTPMGGEVTIYEGPFTGESDEDFTFLGQQVLIEAPGGTVDDPLVIVFVIDSSLVPEGEDENDIVIQKNGLPAGGIGPCDDMFPSGWAVPNPCVASRALDGDDVVITVLTIDASVWTFGVATQSDLDGDGILDGYDECPGTSAGEAADSDGCSIDQLCPCRGPRESGDPWRNHGQYVSCVAQAANTFRRAGLVNRAGVRTTVRDAARSECGHKR